jgi:hypothetical protein
MPMAAFRRLIGALVLLLAITVPASAQRLMLGTWQGTLGPSTVTLTIITTDGQGWVHGTLRYDPPQADGFAGSPFITQIQNGGFSFRLDNDTSFRDIHWCRDALCGTHFAQDDTKTPVIFARPRN